jgi:hypothetical protein
VNLKVMYCPFPNDKVLIGAGERIIRVHNSKHTLDQFRDRIVVSHPLALVDVMSIQQLYIVAHGSAGADSIYDDGGKALSVLKLAQQLKDEGLTTSIKKVKLYCCEGGSDGANSTAARLKQAMQLKSFNSVTTYGYTMLLAQGALTDDGAKMAGDYDFGSQSWSNIRGAKSVRQKF